MAAISENDSKKRGSAAAIASLAGSLVLNAMSAVAIGFSNADRFHDGIFRSMPWAKGSCGDIWSGAAFLVIGFVVAGAVWLARVARSSGESGATLAIARAVVWWGSLLQAAYWMVAAVANFGATCIS